ncbi:MAG: periplasmic heavy metal sensor [Gammaproteobacteria bacterium]|nr:periplasmic heavy metal sensor [Gammaproteobacteria bacterium]
MRSKWLIAALAVSLILNLVLVGFFVGRESGPPAWTQARMDPSFGLARALRFLPEERRDALFGDEEARDIRRSLSRSMRGMRRHQRAIQAALTAEPFDPDALATAFAAFRHDMDEAQTRNHGLFVRIARDLAPEERDQLRRALTRPMRDGPRPNRDGKDDRERRQGER